MPHHCRGFRCRHERIVPDRGDTVGPMARQSGAATRRTAAIAILANRNSFSYGEAGRSEKKRQQNPETWFVLAVYDLFARLTDNPEPGIAGRLHRFTKNCATLIDPRIAVPESENSFQKRLKAALDRRTGGRVPWSGVGAVGK
jgi:hypothetical protein